MCAHNTVDAILIMLMGIYFISCNEAKLSGERTVASALQGLSLTLIVSYFFLLIVWKVLHKRIQILITLIKMKWNSSESMNNSDEVTRSLGHDTDFDSSCYSPLIERSQQRPQDLTY